MPRKIFVGELARVRLRLLQILERLDDHVRRVARTCRAERASAARARGLFVALPSTNSSLRSCAPQSWPSRSPPAPLPILCCRCPADERSTACSSVLQVMTPNATGNCASIATRESSFVTCAEMKSKCGVSPRRRHPSATIASMSPRRSASRASVGISNAPGTR